jgi:hypothetical protein
MLLALHSVAIAYLTSSLDFFVLGRKGFWLAPGAEARHAERRFAMHVPTTAAGIPDGRAHSREIGSSAGEMGMGMGMAALSRQARAKTGASATRGVLVWLDTS